MVSAKQAGNGSDGRLSLRFDAIGFQTSRSIPDLRAIASMMEAEDAQVPRRARRYPWAADYGSGRRRSCHRGGGPVANGLQDVGIPTSNGVLAHFVRAGHKVRRRG